MPLQPKQPIDYTTNVYNALKQKVDGFDKTEEQFKAELANPEYVAKVHNALKSKVDGFDKSYDEFNSLVSLKKKEPSQSVWEKTPSDSSTQPTFMQSLLDTGKPTKQSGSGTSNGVTKTPKSVSDDSIRNDGTQKQTGYFGTLKMQDGSGKDATEISIGVEIEGKETEIPTLVPTLSESEKNYLLKGGSPNDKKNPIAKSIVKKAVDFAYSRKKEGKPYFADNKEYTTLPPAKEGTMAWNFAKLKENNKDFTAPIEEYNSKTSISNQEREDAKREVDALVNQEGIWNNIKAGAKSLTNIVIGGLSESPSMAGLSKFKFTEDPLSDEKEEFIKEFKKNNFNAKKPLTQTQILEGAKKVKENKILKSIKNSKVADFLDTAQSQEDKFGQSKKDKLQIFQTQEILSLNENDKTILKAQNYLRPKIESANSLIGQMEAKFDLAQKNKTQISQEDVKDYEIEFEKRKQLLGQAYELQNDYVENTKDIGNAKDNLDVFKRDYNWFKTNYGNFAATSKDILSGLAGAVNYGIKAREVLGSNLPVKDPKIVSDVIEYVGDIAKGVSKDLKKDAEQTREEIQKPISVDDIKTPYDFGNWMGNLIANQIPILAMVSTGAPGIAGIGAFSTGQQYEKMVDEMNPENPQPGQTIMNYSNAQLLGVPAIYGAAETGSALVDYMILKNAMRVIKSASNSERQLMSKGIFDNLKKVGGGEAKSSLYEGVDELGTEVIERWTDKYLGDKPDTVILENAKDVFVAGAVMGALMTGGSNIVAAAVKPFSTDAKIQKATSDLQKLQEQLDKPGISIENKKIIQQQVEDSKVKVSALVQKVVGDMTSLTNAQFQEIIRLEKAQTNMQSKAEGIVNDSAIDVDMKKQLLNNLQAEFKANNQRRVDLLERGASVRLEALDDKEQIRLKNLAQRRLMQEQNPDGTKSITLNDNEISKRAIQIYNEEALKSKEEAQAKLDEVQAKPIEVTEVVSLDQQKADIEKKREETEAKIINKNLFTGVGDFSKELGGSDKASVPVSRGANNGIEIVEYAHPNTGSIDVIATGKTDNDFVGFYRIYENGKPTNKWSSKFENQSRNKEDFKTMISGVQALLPEGHQYTEATSISTDGLRVWGQQLDRGYELQYDKNGNIVTNTVAINGDAIVNELGVDVNKGNFDNIKITKEQFETVKKALLPYLKKLGLNESNIRYSGEKIPIPGVKASVQIDLPILIKSTKTTKPTEVTEVKSLDEQKAEIEKKYDEEIQKVKDTSPEEQGYLGFNDAANKINSKREAEIKALETPKTEVKAAAPEVKPPKTIEYNKQEYYKNEEGTWVNKTTGNEIKGIGGKGKALINALNAKEKNPTRKYKLTEKGQVFTVEYKNGKLEVTKSDGSKVSKTTELAVLRKHADNYDFTQGEKAMDRMDFEGQDWDNEVAKKSNNASEVAEAVDYAFFDDISNLTPEERVSFKDEIIFDGIGKIKEDSFDRFGDRNKKTDKTAKEYFDEEGRDIDDLADELSGSNGIEISPNDIAEFIERHPNGKKEFKVKQKENLTQEQITKNNKVLGLKNKFTELTGLPATPEFLLKAVKQAARKFAGHDTLDQLTDAQLEAKYNELKEFEEQQYGKQAEKVIEPTKGVDEIKDTEDTGKVQEGAEKVGITKKDLKGLEENYELELSQRRDKISDEELTLMAKNLIESGYDINSLVKKSLADEKYVPTDLELNILAEYAADMKAKIDSNSSNADIAKYRDVLSAINRGTSEAGRALRMAKVKKDVIDSIADIMSDMMDDYNVDSLTKEQRADAEARFKIIEKSLNEHKEALDKVTAELEKLKAEKAVNGLSSKAKRDALAKSSKTSQEYSAERKEIVKNIKDKWNKVAKGGGPITAVPIPFSQQIAAIAPDVAKLISSYLEQGVAVTLDEVRALLKKDIQDAGIDITDNEVNRLIAGEGVVKKESKNELMRQKYQIQQEQKLLIELEKLERGEQQPKTERKRVEKNQRLAELRKKIKELTGEDLDDKFIQTAKQRIKTNEAKANKINDKIKAGDFSKEEKPKSVLDIELLQENNKELYEDYLKSVEDKHEAMYNYELSRQADKIKNENALNKINRYADIAINTSKGTVAMFDQSYFLVQMLPFTLSNPLKAVKFAKQALARDFINAQKFKRDMTILHESPLYDLIKKTGLAILEPRSFESELRSELHGGEKNLWNKEFEFKGKKYSVGQAFERSTVSFMNNARLSLFTNGVEKLYQSGKTFENAPEEFNSLARAINELTAQGKVQTQVQMASPIVNKIIWSPKMFASTLNILGLGDIVRPIETSKAIGRGLGLKIRETEGAKGFYTSLTPTQRKFAVKELSRFISTGVLIMMIAKLNSDEEDDVNIDPRSSGFGSITIGNKKYNIFGRFSSAARTVVQVVGGVRVIEGKEVELGEKFGSKTSGGVLYGSFLRGKATPAAGLAEDLILNNQKNYFTGEDIDFLTATKSLTVPMAVQDMKKNFTRDDILTASATTIAKLYGADISDERDFGGKSVFSKPKTQEEMDKYMRDAMKKASEQMKKNRKQ
jgi:hypothetical protein